MAIKAKKKKILEKKRNIETTKKIKKKSVKKQIRDLPISKKKIVEAKHGESELEETASEAPTPKQESIEYEVSGPLNSVGSKEEEIDLKYNPEKMYESEYKPHDGIEENKKDEEKKAYTTKRDIIT